MQYSNFDMKNNVHATLSTAVSSVATTIQLTAWQWSRFWTTFPQIATIESFDENWKVMKREIVKITARNGDNLTVVRAFAPCPENDDANSQSQSSVSFNADDQISLYIPKEIFDKIHDSLNDIYDNGTNNMRTDIVSWLQVEVNPWSVLVWSAYYDFAGWTITLTDNATNYLEIDEDWNLANNTTGRDEENTKLAIITTVNGSVTKIQDRRLWTVWWKIGGINIHELTEKNIPSQLDELVLSDSENIWNNKKIKISNIIWYSGWLYAQDINIWDALTESRLENSNNLSLEIWKERLSIAVNTAWSWLTGNWFYTYLWKYWNWQNITVRIETDNNWIPSWTLVNENATTTISASDLSTTVSEFFVTFSENITLEKTAVCRIVFSCNSIDVNNYLLLWCWTNYWLSNFKILNWSSRTEYSIYEGETFKGVSSSSTSFLYQRTFTITPLVNIRIDSIWWAWSVWTVYVSEDWTTITDTWWASDILPWLIMKKWHIYVFNWNAQWQVRNSTFWMNFGWSSYFTVSFSGNAPKNNIDMWISVVWFNTYVNWWFILPYLIKALWFDTFWDEMWVALESWSWGTYKKIATNWWVVKNDNRNFVIWSALVYKNWNIVDASNVSPTDTFVYLWQAISKTEIKINLKLHCFIQDTTQRTMPFSWIATCSNGWSISIKWWGYTAQYWVPVLKWRTIQEWNASYWYYIDKNR